MHWNCYFKLFDLKHCKDDIILEGRPWILKEKIAIFIFHNFAHRVVIKEFVIKLPNTINHFHFAEVHNHHKSRKRIDMLRQKNAEANFNTNEDVTEEYIYIYNYSVYNWIFNIIFVIKWNKQISIFMFFFLVLWNIIYKYLRI